ncbi:MAG: M48 family metallopeptidase [Pseudooceanicola sp.]|nr:M48 family metallopeptidase [Pseudooceanicola sp.]
MKLFLPCLLLLLAACTDPVVPVAGPPGGSEAARIQRVVPAVEAAAEAECRRRAFGRNCDFLIVVDSDPASPSNAYQTVDPGGRPVIILTLALIGQAENDDELAFVASHEAAHHIRDHLARRERDMMEGAVVLGGLASLNGGSPADVETAQRLGAVLGARRYSRQFELEADALGTVIAARAGFDPLVGAGFFTRIPDPGDRFLGTHPPNAERVRMVQQTVAGLRS